MHGRSHTTKADLEGYVLHTDKRRNKSDSLFLSPFQGRSHTLPEGGLGSAVGMNNGNKYDWAFLAHDCTKEDLELHSV